MLEEESKQEYSRPYIDLSESTLAATFRLPSSDKQKYRSLRGVDIYQCPASTLELARKQSKQHNRRRFHVLDVLHRPPMAGRGKQNEPRISHTKIAIWRTLKLADKLLRAVLYGVHFAFRGSFRFPLPLVSGSAK